MGSTWVGLEYCHEGRLLGISPETENGMGSRSEACGTVLARDETRPIFEMRQSRARAVLQRSQDWGLFSIPMLFISQEISPFSFLQEVYDFTANRTIKGTI